MVSMKQLFLSLLLGTGALISQAQTKPASKPMQPFKPPVVRTTLLKYADSAFVSAEEAAQLISFPIKVTDAKNTVYTLASYQFAYKRLIVSEDENTGKAYPSTDMILDRFKTSPLPANWQETIKSTLQKGELLYFFDVAVKDAKGRLFFAPELKIYIR